MREGARRALWGVAHPPPCPSGAELLEAPKKILGLNYLAPKAPTKIFEWSKARKKIRPKLFLGGGAPPSLPPPVVPSC